MTLTILLYYGALESSLSRAPHSSLSHSSATIHSPLPNMSSLLGLSSLQLRLTSSSRISQSTAPDTGILVTKKVCDHHSLAVVLLPPDRILSLTSCHMSRMNLSYLWSRWCWELLTLEFRVEHINTLEITYGRTDDGDDNDCPGNDFFRRT